MRHIHHTENDPGLGVTKFQRALNLLQHIKKNVLGIRKTMIYMLVDRLKKHLMPECLWCMRLSLFVCCYVTELAVIFPFNTFWQSGYWSNNIHQATLSQLNCMPTLIAIVLIMIRNVMLIMQMLIMKAISCCSFYGHCRLTQHDLDSCQNK